MEKLNKHICNQKKGMQAVLIFFFGAIAWVLLPSLPAQGEPFTLIKPQYVQDLTRILHIQIPGWQQEAEPTGVTMKEDDKVQTSVQVKFRSGGQLIKSFTIKIEDNGEKASEQMEEIAEAKCSKQYITKIIFKGFPALQLTPPEDNQFGPYGVVSTLFINVADKYLVIIKGNELVDLEVLKAAASYIDLKKLAALN